MIYLNFNTVSAEELGAIWTNALEEYIWVTAHLDNVDHDLDNLETIEQPAAGRCFTAQEFLERYAKAQAHEAKKDALKEQAKNLTGRVIEAKKQLNACLQVGVWLLIEAFNGRYELTMSELATFSLHEPIFVVEGFEKAEARLLPPSPMFDQHLLP